MSTIKFQRIRSCTACHEMLSLKCDKCLEHPERKPKVIELFSWPEVLATGPCGCIQIACQFPGCVNKRWVNPGKNRNKLNVARKLYCSQKCCAKAANAVRMSRSAMLPCTYCGVQVRRTQYRLSLNHAKAFCHQEHFRMWRIKQAHEEKQEKRDSLDNGNLGTLYCSPCKDITEHDTPRFGNATCRKCGNKRAQSISPLGRASSVSLSQRIPA